MEAVPSTYAAIKEVLAGRASYDSLPNESQAVVRVAWEDEIKTRIAGLNFEQHLNEAGRPWAESDTEGNTIIRRPDPETA